MSTLATDRWQGEVAPGFEPVAERLDRCITEMGEAGLAFTAYLEGTPVVDIWSGSAGDRPWDRDTTTWVFSCTKGALALCVQILLDRGLLDIEQPVRHYWPEFGAAGKGDVLVKHLLSHQAAVFAFPGYPELIGNDWSGMPRWSEITAALAASPATAPPGEFPFYHAVSIGFLAGELVRRIDGRTPGRFFADEVAGPLGLDFHIGLPAELIPHMATLLPGPPIGELELTEQERQFAELYAAAIMAARERVLEGDVLSREAIPWSAGWIATDALPDFLIKRCKEPWLVGCEIPAGNGIGTARALARMYALLAEGGTLDGVRLVSPESIAKATTTLAFVPGLGEVGMIYHRPGPTHMGTFEIPTAFGHAGAGGNLAFADPARRLSFAYTKNRHMPSYSSGPKVVETLYGCL